MPTDHRRELAGIKRFDQLIAYLRDEMGWPIESEDFEDLYFEYTPDELGIDAKNAAKIQEIKRLRPLAPEQPWGIFFVKFEPKRLPVVALRRILSRVVLKKRTTANSDERTAWEMADLLFISNYGGEEERRISFAHFVQDDDWGDLPTLKLLGWDADDTGLHLDDVAAQLTTKLRWPDDEADIETWRTSWASAFTLRNREVITTSRRLAEALAALARVTYKKMRAALAIEAENGPLRKLMDGFTKALIHDLDDDGFADMYAQTIAYGLLSARISRPAGLTADNMADLVPVTNPFLKEMLESFLRLGGRRRSEQNATGIDFDELGINEIVQLLRDANMEAVVRDFGDKNPEEDPVIHFYEDFIAQYDPRRRKQRGVFYTPRPVVSYIVRSVDELLRTEFGLEDGLADTTTWGEMAERHADLKIPDGVSPDQAFVQILDPATGTATFLVEVIDLIHCTTVAKWQTQGYREKQILDLWNDYVPKHLLTRLHGYELMMAPYAIAHLKIGLKLHETGYRFQSDERARVYLTNALEPASDWQLTLDFLPALAHEAQSVNEIKRKQRFTVVIGNPPYSKLSSNWNEWIDGLLHGKGGAVSAADYYQCDGSPLGERTVWIQDDYIKFVRLSQLQIDQSTAGIHAFITNNGYLDNPTLRGMRQQLKSTFSQVRVLDLYGSAKRGDSTSEKGTDQNVFDIQQGVAIGVFSRPATESPGSVRHAGLRGDRGCKYDALAQRDVSSIAYEQVGSASPAHLFINFDATNEAEYQAGHKVTDIFGIYHSGIITKRDSLAIKWTADESFRTVSEFERLDPEDARKRFNLPADVRDWKITWAQADLRETGISRSHVIPLLYRPFDVRFTYFTGRSRGFVGWPVADITRLMLSGDNLALVTTRMTKGESFEHLLVSRHMVEVICLSAKTSNNGFIFPLMCSDALVNDGGLFGTGEEGKTYNLNPTFLELLSDRLGIPFEAQSPEGRSGVFCAIDVFNYIVGLISSPAYRQRYSEFLCREFPRILLPGSLALFHDLKKCGRKVVDFQLLDSPEVNEFVTSYTGPGHPEISRVGWSDGTVWLDAGKTNAREGHRATQPGTFGFQGVAEHVWHFHIGGYQVCHKWLKDRKGRTLSDDDITHYQKIIVAIRETIRIMREIDDVIEEHGGWPGAFQTAKQSEPEDV